MAERILVVDDESTVREIIASMLASEYECRQASDGLEALAVLDSGEDIALILADLVMPNLDGFGLLEHVNKKHPKIPVVMVTAVHDIQCCLRALRGGAYEYFLKPFSREQLLGMVRWAIERKHRQTVRCPQCGSIFVPKPLDSTQ